MARARRSALRAARWLAPSIVAACAGAVVAGALALFAMPPDRLPDLPDAAAGIGFTAMLVVPVLAAASAATRALYAGWRPRDTVASQRSPERADDGARLAGWVATIWLGALGLAWATFQGTWLLATRTTFKPLVIGFGVPVITVGAALIAVALSRPCARLLAAAARRVDARWRRAGRRSLLAPRAIFGGALAASLAVGYVAWRVLVRDRVGAVDFTLAYLAAAAVAAAAIAHAVWTRSGRRRALAGAAIVALTAAAAGWAALATRTHPAATLAAWGDHPVARVAIARAFDLEAIRARVPAARVRPEALHGAAHPDLVLVTVDALRADRTPPRADAAELAVVRGLAARGATFVAAYAPSNTPPRTLASLVTGVAPDRVRAAITGTTAALDPRHVTFAERLAAGGYDTAAFACCAELWTGGLARGLAHLELAPTAPAQVAAAVAWLDARAARGATRPALVWLHLRPPRDWDAAPREQRRAAYDRALAAADAALVPLVAALGSRPAAREPVWIVTATHGEPLGEHGQALPGTDLSSAQLHVPLVIAGGGAVARRVHDTVGLVDLAPTLLELAGFAPPPHLDGVSLAPLARAYGGGPRPRPAFALMVAGRRRQATAATIIEGGWKLIDYGATEELFELRVDPGERFNIVNQNLATGERLRKLLADQRAPRPLVFDF